MTRFDQLILKAAISNISQISESGEGPDMIGSCERGERKADTDDALSEAGTYVVGKPLTTKIADICLKAFGEGCQF